jgi:hypothetical protein
MACETCVNRTNAPGDGPCVNCDLTFDGPESSYLAEADAPVVLNAGDVDGADEELDAFAAQSAAGLPMTVGTDEAKPTASEALDALGSLEDDDGEDDGEDEND